MSKVELPQPTTDAIFRAIEERNTDLPRPHLGASLLGHHCSRWLWLSFRWAIREQHSGRVLRLFRRGQDEESRVVEDLRAAGMDVRDKGEDGRQFRVEFGAHVSGSLDGVILSGVPEAPKKVHVMEIKTHSLKSFADMEKNGVEKSKPMHWAQMQVYMHGTDISRALYVAVCKDDDRIYTERVRYSPDDALGLVQRGHDVVFDPQLPPPVSTDPSWYQCKMCPAYPLCHESAPIREINCRTCAHSTANSQGWICERWNDAEIPLDAQRAGCRSHVPHPQLVPWPVLRGVGEWSAAFDIGGQEVVIGEDGADSREVLQC